MLTGDENIVDVDFTVLWRIKPDGVGNFLFNIQNPEGTVKAVAESAMREVIGRSDIQPILTGARTATELAVQELMQKTLDEYGSGVLVQQVQMQKVDPPAQVIDAFRDVQAARADQERLQNEARTYANRVIPDARGRSAQPPPEVQSAFRDVNNAEQDKASKVNEANTYRNRVINEAKGDAAKIIQAAQGYREQAVREAQGEAARFNQIQAEYRRAPGVTRDRLYIETMQRVLQSSNKVVIDAKGASAPIILPPDVFRARPATPAPAPVPQVEATPPQPQRRSGQ